MRCLLLGVVSGVAPALANEPPPAAWALVWQDEFDAERIDPTRWDLEHNCWGGGNAERQCYTERERRELGANAYVENGMLTIEARIEAFTGPVSYDGKGRASATRTYTSARLRTLRRQEWTFGRFEIRARLPRGQGMWPAIWMLPTDSAYGGWAAGGEIDIMEAINLGARPDAPGAAPGATESRVHGTLHYGRPAPGNVYSGSTYTPPLDSHPADGFHVYALEWEEGEMRWYFDDVHYATQYASQWWSQQRVEGRWVDAPAGAPFDRHSRFHLLLNLAVGGRWPEGANAGGVDDSVLPQRFLIDFVRVYRCSTGSADGRGCATRGGARPAYTSLRGQPGAPHRE